MGEGGYQLNGVKYKKEEIKIGKDKSAETPRFGGFFYFFLEDSIKITQDRQAIVDVVNCLAETVQAASAASEKPVRCKRNKAK